MGSARRFALSQTELTLAFSKLGHYEFFVWRADRQLGQRPGEGDSNAPELGRYSRAYA